MTRVRKLTNVSEVSVPVLLTNGMTVYISPKGILENVEVENFHLIQRFIKAEIDLGDINEKKTGKTYLKS